MNESYFFALSMGVLHALEPGHGKTAIAMFSITQDIERRQVFSLITGIFLSHSLMLICIAILLKTLLVGVNEDYIHSTITLIGSMILFYIGYGLFPRSERHSESCNCALHANTKAHNHSKLHFFGKNRLSSNYGILQFDVPNRKVKKKGLKIASLIGISGGLIPCPTAIASFLAFISVGDFFGGIIGVSLFSLGMVFTLSGVVFISKILGSTLIGKLKSNQNHKFKIQIISSCLVVCAGFYSLIPVVGKFYYRIFL